MKQQVEKLYRISHKKSRRIIGLMSGTSLDGLDIALCNISGNGTETSLVTEKFTTIPYTDSFKENIRKIFAKREIDFQNLCLLNPYIGIEQGKMIAQCLSDWHIESSEIDLIASHGQTVFHAPKKQHMVAGFPNATLQIGDADHIAMITGIITISDFRQKHIAAGGEGAPLAVYGDYYLFSKKDENRILLNMGGIANFTLLSGDFNPASIFTTDTGPGNTLIDAYVRRYFHMAYDQNGEIAAKGTVSQPLLAQLKKSSFFDASFPKTTGPEVFNFEYVEQALQKSGITSISRNDMIATLTQLSADTISDAILKTVDPSQKYILYTSGGGAHNPVLIAAIQAKLANFPIKSLEELGVAGDAKEAVLFAVLANETVAGSDDSSFGQLAGVPNVSMGKVSFPK